MPKESVIGLVFNAQRDRVLLIKRRDVNAYALPGGGIDPGESPEDAFVREIQEETGLIVGNFRKAAIFFPINRLAYTTYVFETMETSGTIAISNETREVSFFPLDALPSTLFFLHKKWIQEIVASSQMITRPISEVTYWNLFLYILKNPVDVFRLMLSRLGFPIND